MRKTSGGTPFTPRAAFVLLLAAACGGGDERGRAGQAPAAGDSAGPPESGGTAVMAELADISHPMPLVAESVLDGDIGGDVMFPSLTRSVWRDGHVVYTTYPESPVALARAYEYLPPDSTALRYHLNTQHKWSDGRPVTAADVVFTYEMLKNPAVASPQQDYASNMDSVVANDDSTVTFHFNRRYPDMLFHSGLGISPKHLFEGSDPAQMRTHRAFVDPVRNLVVSGPYRIGEWVKNDHFTLVPNPYFTPKPRLERIVFRVIPEATTRLAELLTGNLDFMRPVPYDQVERARQQAPGVRFAREEGRAYDYIAYNPRTFAPFADPEIRRALGMAIDVRGLLSALQMDEYAKPAGGPYSPIFKDLYDPQTMPPLPYDTAEAKRILASKGWADHDGDGIVERNGQPFRFTVLTNAGNSRRIDVAQIVQQAWKRIGVDAQIRMSETNAFNETLRGKRFQAAVAGWVVGLSPDITTLWGKDSPFNFVSYDDPQTFALFRQAQAQPTEAGANPIWRQAAARIAAAQPYTFLYYYDQLDGLSSRLRDMKVDTYGAYQNAWEWWIPRSQQNARRQAAPAVPPAADTGKK
ncbi:MAG TPA: ABC transporter substrate-binding protein [Longimicrobium sp.]